MYMDDSLLFYSRYHSHPVNKAIHFVFVPIILFSTYIFLAYIPPLSDQAIEFGSATAPLSWIHE
jgi:uncharacterized membrane protein YGL010W